MLKKIVRVDDFRAMRVWSTPVEFQSVNLIYGSNGSGKSTFAALFESYARDPQATGPVRVEILDASSQPLTLTGMDDFFWPNVRVFNRGYVARSIRFDGASGPNASALMTLGERQIEAEARREEIQVRLDAIAIEQPPLQTEISNAQRGHDGLLTRTAQQIGQELQSAGDRYASRSYRAPNVRALLGDRETLAAGVSSEIERDLMTVAAPAMDSVVSPSFAIPDLPALNQELQELRARTVTSVPIPELAADVQAERWAQAGLPIHEHSSNCFFCGNDVSEERRAELGRHFDASLVALQRDLAGLRTRVNDAVESADRTVSGLPVANLLFESLRESYGQAVEATQARLALYESYATALETAIDEKAEHLFTALPSARVPEYVALDLTDVAALIEQHNSQVSDFETLRMDAAGRVECSRVLAIVGETPVSDTAYSG